MKFPAALTLFVFIGMAVFGLCMMSGMMPHDGLCAASGQALVFCPDNPARQLIGILWLPLVAACSLVLTSVFGVNSSSLERHISSTMRLDRESFPPMPLAVAFSDGILHPKLCA